MGGYDLMRGIPVYPEFISEEWIDSDLLPKVRSAVDDHGYAQIPDLEDLQL